MEALRRSLEEYYPDIKLQIASFSNSSFKPYTCGNSTYWGIPRDIPSGKIKRIIWNWKHSIHSEVELQRCVDIANICKPDLIHIHGSESLFGLVQGRTDIPVVISLQGIISSYQYFTFAGFELRERLKLFGIEYVKGRGIFHEVVWQRHQSERERRILKQCRYVIGRTQWDRDFCKLMNPEVKYYKVGEILRDPFYEYSWDPTRLDTQTVFSTISSGPRKGALLLIEAIGILKHYGYPNIQLRLAGLIRRSHIWPIIERRIRKNEIKENVVLLGAMNASELARELAQCSVFAHPSFIDNSPNSLAEAMIVGAPCVATAVGGVPSMLEEGEEGYLCTPGDPYSLASNINELLSNVENAQKIASNAKRIALTRHDSQLVTKQLLSAYKNIVQGEDSSTS